MRAGRVRSCRPARATVGTTTKTGVHVTLWLPEPITHQEARLEDPVAVDAKRILLRYGTPILVLDKVPSEERITLARLIARTPLTERETRLRELLAEAGHLKQ